MSYFVNKRRRFNGEEWGEWRYNVHDGIEEVGEFLNLGLVADAIVGISRQRRVDLEDIGLFTYGPKMRPRILSLVVGVTMDGVDAMKQETSLSAEELGDLAVEVRDKYRAPED